ncbi:MAG: DUF302 domain-containing protein [Pseudomonadota bacterium]|nr:MAG: DUF302 domain-containing protein [Pseudomonadota bacterium]
MGKKVMHVFLWMLSGMALMGAIVWFAMPSLMLIEHKSPLNYEETVAALNDVIEKKQNWKVPKTFDFQKNIQDAGHGPISRVGTVALCNPFYASRILQEDENRKVTAFMPLGIGVYQDKDEQVYISELNVGLLGMMFGGTIADVMADAGNDVKEIIASATVR